MQIPAVAKEDHHDLGPNRVRYFNAITSTSKVQRDVEFSKKKRRSNVLEEIPEKFLYLFDDPNIPDVEFNTLRDII